MARQLLLACSALALAHSLPHGVWSEESMTNTAAAFSWKTGTPNRSDFATSYLREKMLESAPVVAAQGTFTGPPVLSAIFGTNNFAALTEFDSAVGLITIGNDGKGGCAVVPFHNHPNCYEYMTTISGYGAYGQVRPDGTTAWSPIMRPGDVYVMRQSSQHFYRNLDPKGTWQFEISFTCSEVGSSSAWKWLLQLDKQLAKQFFDVSDATAESIISPIDPATGEQYTYEGVSKVSSIRYIPECATEAATWDTKMANDGHLKFKGLFESQPILKSPDGRSALRLLAAPYRGPASEAPTTYSTTGTFPGIDGFGYSISYITIATGDMMMPMTVANAHTVYHVLTPEGTNPFSVDGQHILVCQFTYNSQLVVDTLQGHDVVIVPRGTLHFIVNIGENAARILGHYDTQFPTMGVTSDFFPNLPANMVKGLMGVTAAAAKEMSRPGFKQPAFKKFSGTLATLHEWVLKKPTYNVLDNPDEETEADKMSISYLLTALKIDQKYLAKFEAHEIDWDAVKHLRVRQMTSVLGLPLGPALKIQAFFRKKWHHGGRMHAPPGRTMTRMT